MLRPSSLAVLAALAQLIDASHKPSSPGQSPDSAWNSSETLVTDLDWISRNWGYISTYRDNPDNAFGVNDVGLPDGCQVEQVHVLHRHAERFPTSGFDDGRNNENFVARVYNSTTGPNATFTGPLAFLNSYQYHLGRSYLTGLGAATEFASGVQFWNDYGRFLFNASAGQLQYNGSFANGSARAKPVIRTTDQSRIHNSMLSWALGFFGPSYAPTPDPQLTAFANGSLFDAVLIPEDGKANNTLASYQACLRDIPPDVAMPGEFATFSQYLPMYLASATARLQKYVPDGLVLSVNDTYAMQMICAYEHASIGTSDFCGLFTKDEWSGFEQTLDAKYYYDYGFGNPTGRAQGLGYQQELYARLTKQLIMSSNSSVNSTITNNPDQFPLDRPFYADFTHDDILISVLTSMSIDYFRQYPDLSQYPPDPDRPFILSRLTPFGARLYTEVIGCTAPNPGITHSARTNYWPGQNGYDPSNATNKFVRMRLNKGIIPLSSIRTGECADRTDGLCAMDKFLASQEEAMKLANYDFACFTNYTVINPHNQNDWDGTVNNQTGSIIIHPGRLTADSVGYEVA